MSTAIPPQDDDKGAMKIIGYVMGIAGAAFKYGVGVQSGWVNKISSKKIVSESSFYGDPNRYAQGFHDTTKQNTIYDDPYINFIIATFLPYKKTGISFNTYLTSPELNSGSSFDPYRTISETISDSYSTLTDLVAVPSKNKSEKYGPVLVTLDWDVALVDPTEAKPMFKYYNIVEGSRGAYTAMINVACSRIFIDYKLPAIWTLSAYASAGEANVFKWLHQSGGSINVSLKNAFQTAEEQTGLMGHIASRINKQIFTNNDPKNITMAKAAGVNPSDIQNYMAAMKNIARYKNLAKMCAANPPRLIYTLLSSKITKYNIRGPISTVTTVTHSLNEAGGTSQIGSTSHSVASEGLIKNASPLKRNLSWPTGPALTPATNNPNLMYSRVQLPTTNWEDIIRVYNACPKNITQASASYKFYAENVKIAISNFYNSVNGLGIKTANMSYDSIKETGTYDVTYTYAS